MYRSKATAAVFLVTILGAAEASASDPAAALAMPNPGARSMALGGAFVAQADDATAAFANPAGLVQLLDPEISAELRLRLYPSDNSLLPGGDGSEISDLSAVGFASAVYPIRGFSLQARPGT